MIELQVLSRILDSKDFSFIKNSEEEITSEYFNSYAKQYEFIESHYKKYNKVPDVETFISKFPDIELPEVYEDNEYLLEELKHEYTYNKILPVLEQGVNLFQQGNIIEACDYLISDIPKAKQLATKPKDIGVIESIQERIHNYEFVNQNSFANFIPTGFDEIDRDIVGWKRGEELVVIYARTNMGKSWVLEAFCTNAVKQGYRVGYFSPEMSKESVGYRFDTLYGNLSNSAMTFGRVTENFNLDIYKAYADTLKDIKGEMKVTTPADFSRKLTVSKLREWIEQSKLDMVAIDGITYLTDERFKKGDSKTISLTNISEDLMELSVEMKVPILVVVQANRGGVLDKTSLDTPELENIRDSDGIAMNASKVYAVRQIRNNDDVTLLIDNKKMRGAEMGQSYSYTWDIDLGKFEYVDKSTLDTGDDTYDAPTPERKEPTAGRRTKRERVSEDDY